MSGKDEFIGLVIGYGSIGWRHCAALAALTPELVIVEIKEGARAQAAEAHPSARIVENLNGLDDEDIQWSRVVAVIASWGPSHADLFHDLVDRGVRRILCEKPMAASISQAQEMATRAEKEGVSLGVHHFIRYTRLVPALQDYAAEHALGEPVAIVVQGGAAGLITNGLHWIDTATHLFGSPPKDVISTAYAQPINPRSPEVMLYGGTAVWRFSDEREAIVSFSNNSSVKLTTTIYYRNAVATTDSDASGVTVRERDLLAVERYPAVTRTGPACEVLFEGLLPGMRSFDEGLQDMLVSVSEGNVSTADAWVGVSALSSCIGMLLAGREGQVVSLPINAESEWGREIWPIS